MPEPIDGGPFLEAFEITKPVAVVAPEAPPAPEVELEPFRVEPEPEVIAAIEPPKKPLAKLSKAQLVAYATEIGVKVVPDSMTSKQIIAAIEGK